MNPYYAYILGLLTLFIVIFPFWLLSMYYRFISIIYLEFFCKRAVTYPV
jgi:hypothetical protein